MLAALLLDVLDGMLARMLDVSSDMGKELDSLADMVSFGLAPAYLYILFSPFESWVKYVPPAIFVLGAAIRLARFNILPSSKYFKGMPTPTASFFLIGIFLAHHYGDNWIADRYESPALYLMTPIVLTVLMNSKFTMFSIKTINSGFKMDIFFPLICFLFFIMLVLIDFQIAFPLTVVFYLTMSFIYNFVAKRR
jgi:CDP-diacylglycerol--serine O-phosphatidyltransferase